jgi:multiple sugar transport system substrate-binding protein
MKKMQSGKAVIAALLVSLLLGSPMLGGCKNPDRPSPKNPVSLVIWHTMGDAVREGFEQLLQEFNETLGSKEGITLSGVAVGYTEVFHERLMAAANHDPGSPGLPDMAVVYPQVALELVEKGFLMDFSGQFSQKELDRYVPSFLEEGRMEGGIYLLPIAKSTELLFVNTTLFNRFAAAYKGAHPGEGSLGLSDLASLEGLLDVADKYRQWSGKAFFMLSSRFNFLGASYAQLGDLLVKDNRLNLSSPAFDRIGDTYFASVLRGGSATFGGYGNQFAMSADILCYVASSASGSYVPNSVTYVYTNTRDSVEFAVLPYPVFRGGEKAAIQQGGGMAVFKSDRAREYAAALFLKWFTSPEQNLRFTLATGYLPVQTEAFNQALDGTIQSDNPVVQASLAAAVGMVKDYRLVSDPVFSGYETLRDALSKALLEAEAQGRSLYLEGKDGRQALGTLRTQFTSQ